MVFTFTGLVDKITDLKIEESNIEVTLKVHGTFKVSHIKNRVAYDALKQMKVGQEVLVATDCGRLMWIKPE